MSFEIELREIEGRDLRNQLIGELIDVIGRDKISWSFSDLILYSRDMFALGTYYFRKGKTFQFPYVIVYPEEEQDIVKVLKFAGRNSIPVIVYGGGSGVCGALINFEPSIIIDMKRLNRIKFFSKYEKVIIVEAGIIGQVLENELNKRGFTLGHFPSSIYCSTVGGYFATRSAGQMSTLYGKFEDMVMGFKVITADGKVYKEEGSSLYPGMLDSIFIGSEGTLGVITEIKLRIVPLPEKREFISYMFSDVGEGLKAIKEIIQDNVYPAVVRLYDPFDTIVAGRDSSAKVSLTGKLMDIPRNKYISDLFRFIFEKGEQFILANPEILMKVERFLPKNCLLIMVVEGKERNTRLYKKIIEEKCRSNGGVKTERNYAKSWWSNRYKISYYQSKIFYSGSLVDTVEVILPWHSVEKAYYEVRKNLKGKAFIMAHFSHFYAQGAVIYFTFLLSGSDKEELIKRYMEVWDILTEVIYKNRGSVGHHHGVGVIRNHWLSRQHGSAWQIYLAAKSTLDPKNILNRSKLDGKDKIKVKLL